MATLKQACGDELTDIRVILRLIKNALDHSDPSEQNWGDMAWIVGSLEDKVSGLIEAVEGAD